MVSLKAMLEPLHMPLSCPQAAQLPLTFTNSLVCKLSGQVVSLKMVLEPPGVVERINAALPDQASIGILAVLYQGAWGGEPRDLGWFYNRLGWMLAGPCGQCACPRHRSFCLFAMPSCLPQPSLHKPTPAPPLADPGVWLRARHKRL